mgnify:CR=1 FL=1
MSDKNNLDELYEKTIKETLSYIDGMGNVSQETKEDFKNKIRSISKEEFEAMTKNLSPNHFISPLEEEEDKIFPLSYCENEINEIWGKEQSFSPFSVKDTANAVVEKIKKDEE